MARHTPIPLTSGVLLRDMTKDDLPTFFKQQLDPDASHMAAFTIKEPTNRNMFKAYWNRILGDKRIIIKTILFEGHVAGYVLSHEWFGEPEVSYWIGKKQWGNGIATTALTYFLGIFKTRPLYGRAAKDNIGSLRVLQKCGFAICAEGKRFSYVRDEKVEEFILKLV